MKKKRIIIISAVVVVIGLIAWFSKSKSSTQTDLFATVARGDFEVTVTVTGELQALNSTNVEGPIELRTGRGMRFSEIKIQSLVPEGTVVQKGDLIATLSRTEALNSLRDREDAVTTAERAFQTAQLDSTSSLGSLRNDLINLKFNVEEAKITLEESKYEPPTTIRQAQINVEKAERAYEVALSEYQLSEQKQVTAVASKELDLEQEIRRRDELIAVMEKFDIYAPQNGMVIYYKSFDGTKRKEGSTIEPFDLTVATLPDLTIMNSETYVNEIDVSKVKVGQEVRIGVDAFPERKYTGVVTSVANVGEQLSNTDAKVFETIIEMNEYDEILRPSMTTSNTIIINKLEDVTYIPLEAVFSMDSIPVVYTKKGVKQIVVLGETNENQAVIEQGLTPGEVIYLSTPEDTEHMRLRGEELIPIIQERAREKAEAIRKAAEQAEKTIHRGGRGGFPGGGQMPQGGFPSGEMPQGGFPGGEMPQGFPGGEMPQGFPGGEMPQGAGPQF